MASKTIEGAFPAILTSEQEYQDLLKRNNIRCLVNSKNHQIYGYAALVDGETYTAGSELAEAKEQVLTDYRARFLGLIRSHSPREDVSPETFRILERKFLLRFQYAANCGDYETAQELLEEARNFPQETTVAALREHAHLSVDGPFTTLSLSASFFHATNTQTSRPIIIKYPNANFRQEIDVCRELKLQNLDLDSPCALTPIEVCTTTIRKGGSRPDITVLVMPKFCETLVSPPKFLELDCVLTGAKRIISALNYIHALGFVHMDVKGDNIFLAMDGRWYLGDFGSCVRAGTRVISYTDIFLWYRLRLTRQPGESGQPDLEPSNAEFRYDWQMLAVALIIQAIACLNEHRELQSADLSFKSLMRPLNGRDIVNEELLLQVVEKLKNPALKALLLKLMYYAESQLIVST